MAQPQKKIYDAVRLDKLQATYAGNIASVRMAQETPNGRLITLGSLEMGSTLETRNREVYQSATPVDLSTQEVLMVASPETSYDPTDQIVNFVNVEGSVARAPHFTVGDIVTVTDGSIDGTSVKDQYVVPQTANDKWKPSATLGNTRLVGKVIEKTKIYNGTNATVIEIVKC